jgi:ribonucleoside-diphosphate reductase alpha chain
MLRREALGFLDLAPASRPRPRWASAMPSTSRLHQARRRSGAARQAPRPFDLDRLGAALKPERDLQFTYLGLQTLYDRYFIHSKGTRFELPQAFFMRVAMGLAINEIDREERAIEFYNLLSSFDFMSSTPTLFNSGTLRPQLSRAVT